MVPGSPQISEDIMEYTRECLQSMQYWNEAAALSGRRTLEAQAKDLFYFFDGFRQYLREA